VCVCSVSPLGHRREASMVNDRGGFIVSKPPLL
jgi:hypothetical protein